MVQLPSKLVESLNLVPTVMSSLNKPDDGTLADEESAEEGEIKDDSSDDDGAVINPSSPRNFESWARGSQHPSYGEPSYRHPTSARASRTKLHKERTASKEEDGVRYGYPECVREVYEKEDGWQDERVEKENQRVGSSHSKTRRCSKRLAPSSSPSHSPSPVDKPTQHKRRKYKQHTDSMKKSYPSTSARQTGSSRTNRRDTRKTSESDVEIQIQKTKERFKNEVFVMPKIPKVPLEQPASTAITTVPAESVKMENDNAANVDECSILSDVSEDAALTVRMTPEASKPSDNMAVKSDEETPLVEDAERDVDSEELSLRALALQSALRAKYGKKRKAKTGQQTIVTIPSPDNMGTILEPVDMDIAHSGDEMEESSPSKIEEPVVYIPILEPPPLPPFLYMEDEFEVTAVNDSVELAPQNTQNASQEEEDDELLRAQLLIQISNKEVEATMTEKNVSTPLFAESLASVSNVSLNLAPNVLSALKSLPLIPPTPPVFPLLSVQNTVIAPRSIPAARTPSRMPVKNQYKVSKSGNKLIRKDIYTKKKMLLLTARNLKMKQKFQVANAGALRTSSAGRKRHPQVKVSVPGSSSTATNRISNNQERLVICLGEDSDSEEDVEVEKNKRPSPNKKVPLDLDRSVDQFLAQVRQTVENSEQKKSSTVVHEEVPAKIEEDLRNPSSVTKPDSSHSLHVTASSLLLEEKSFSSDELKVGKARVTSKMRRNSTGDVASKQVPSESVSLQPSAVSTATTSQPSTADLEPLQPPIRSPTSSESTNDAKIPNNQPVPEVNLKSKGSLLKEKSINSVTHGRPSGMEKPAVKTPKSLVKPVVRSPIKAPDLSLRSSSVIRSLGQTTLKTPSTKVPSTKISLTTLESPKKQPVVAPGSSLALSHLPSSQQVEYRRLKLEIARREELKKLQARLGKPVPKKDSMLMDGMTLEITLRPGDSEGTRSVRQSTPEVDEPVATETVHDNGCVRQGWCVSPRNDPVEPTDERTSGKPMENKDEPTIQGTEIEKINEIHKEAESDGAKLSDSSNVNKISPTFKHKIIKRLKNVRSKRLRSASQHSESLPPELVNLANNEKWDALHKSEKDLLAKRRHLGEKLSLLASLLQDVKAGQLQLLDVESRAELLRKELRKAEEQAEEKRLNMKKLFTQVGQVRFDVAQTRTRCSTLAKTCTALGRSCNGIDSTYRLPQEENASLKQHLQLVVNLTKQTKQNLQPSSIQFHVISSHSPLSPCLSDGQIPQEIPDKGTLDEQSVKDSHLADSPLTDAMDEEDSNLIISSSSKVDQPTWSTSLDCQTCPDTSHQPPICPLPFNSTSTSDTSTHQTYSNFQKKTVRPYVSPLSHMNKESSLNQPSSLSMDPNKVLCPFALTGICLDEECKYQHPLRLPPP